jgi:hypothetical protein
MENSCIIRPNFDWNGGYTNALLEFLALIRTLFSFYAGGRPMWPNRIFVCFSESANTGFILPRPTDVLSVRSGHSCTRTNASVSSVSSCWSRWQL